MSNQLIAEKVLELAENRYKIPRFPNTSIVFLFICIVEIKKLFYVADNAKNQVVCA